VIKFNEASANSASGSEDLSEKDVQDRHQAMMAKLTLPTLDEEDEEFSSRQPKPTRAATIASRACAG
jgi:hypothetical protein